MDVERIFSQGRVILSYLRNRLSVQTVRALICVNEWTKAGIITEKHIHDCIWGLKDIDEDDESYVAEGWDTITM